MAPAPGLAQYLRPGEEEWTDLLEKLNERFPAFGPERVAQILRENDGHGGQAAGVLRDLSGTSMRPVDPDDAEHVRTLLSSPAMFAHACKEHFRKFDINSDGALEWSEIVALVNSLYDNFGLQPPREGGLRAFFEASDTNGDGVLTEKEFKRFFECFLRYAFFDVVNHEQGAPPQELRPQSSHSSENRHKEHKQHKEHKPSPSPTRESRKTHVVEEEQPSPPHREKKERESRRHKSSPEAAEAKYFQCVAPNGCSYRRSTDYHDRAGSGVPRGEVVQALEAWIRTPQGWLPLSLESGEVLFEPCDASKAAERGAHDAGGARSTPKHRSEGERSSKRSSRREEDGEGRRRKDKERPAPMMEPVMEPPAPAGLLPHEEEWRELFERLQGRFPAASPGQIAEVLRLVDGHAGHAAQKLREMTR